MHYSSIHETAAAIFAAAILFTHELTVLQLSSSPLSLIGSARISAVCPSTSPISSQLQQSQRIPVQKTEIATTMAGKMSETTISNAHVTALGALDSEAPQRNFSYTKPALFKPTFSFFLPKTPSPHPPFATPTTSITSLLHHHQHFATPFHTSTVCPHLPHSPRASQTDQLPHSTSKLTQLLSPCLLSRHPPAPPLALRSPPRSPPSASARPLSSKSPC